MIVFLVAGLAAAAAPAWANTAAGSASAMALDCNKGVSNGDAYASCFGRLGEEWRLRADCAFQPDRYSDWQNGDGNVTVSCTVGDARAAIIEVR
ncbi:hypothetical protein [Nocardiopsis synnemataformans]|uniref:hypothetical protein n=1 Tax=Nocardiopsis synnemataformans TaxID=61305 RepID=UPI003EBDE157